MYQISKILRILYNLQNHEGIFQFKLEFLHISYYFIYLCSFKHGVHLYHKLDNNFHTYLFYMIDDIYNNLDSWPSLNILQDIMPAFFLKYKWF